MKSFPMVVTWDGEALRPLRRFQRVADQNLVIGEEYRVDPEEERSIASHNFFFASVTEAWRNLSEDMSLQFPTPESLRKRALIKAGYADVRSIVCASKAEAERVAAFVRPMEREAVVLVSEAVVTVYTAQSQSFRAMGAAAFNKSKDDVLGVLADMLGVEKEALAKQGRDQ